MVRRFTVIQGGLSGMPAAAPEPDAAPLRSEAAGASMMWRVDLRAPNAVGEEAVSAWRAMLVRNAVSDPLRDPDHLLPLAQHRPAGRRVAVALAWSQDTETGREALRGVVPLAMPHPVWGGRARPWQPAEAAATALVENATALAVDRALRARLAGLRRPIRLVGTVEPLRLAAPFRPSVVADRSARPRSIPTGAFVGTRPPGWEAPGAEMLGVTEPEAVRDAVETFLTLDARTANRPIIADPSEASLVRVVSRLFGRRGALRVEFLRRAGEIVAGTLHLGVGGASVPWRRARA
jgi:hypothetical protein